MMQSLYESELRWWALMPLASIVLLAISELGFRLGRRSRRSKSPANREPTHIIVTAMLALLGLLLAFSFSIVESRFGKRKALVLEEANAIGTCYLRTAVLPSPERERIRELLRSYVQVRLSAPKSQPDLDRAIEASEELHFDLWHEAMVVARATPESEMVALFVRSLNEVIDMHESRVTVALHQRLPHPILYALLFMAALSTALVGLSAGLVAGRALAPTAALVLGVAAVVVLIVELDRPGSRMMPVTMSALEDLQQTMDASSAPERARAPR